MQGCLIDLKSFTDLIAYLDKPLGGVVLHGLNEESNPYWKEINLSITSHEIGHPSLNVEVVICNHPGPIQQCNVWSMAELDYEEPIREVDPQEVMLGSPKHL